MPPLNRLALLYPGGSRVIPRYYSTNTLYIVRVLLRMPRLLQGHQQEAAEAARERDRVQRVSEQRVRKDERRDRRTESDGSCKSDQDEHRVHRTRPRLHCPELRHLRLAAAARAASANYYNLYNRAQARRPRPPLTHDRLAQPPTCTSSGGGLPTAPNLHERLCALVDMHRSCDVYLGSPCVFACARVC